VRTSVHAPLRPSFDPGPARGATFVATPLFALESARRRRRIEVTLSAGHFSSTSVPRHFDRIACAFTVRAIRPWAWQLAMIMTMLGTDCHDAQCYREALITVEARLSR
jgi:hypothetical protein